MFGDCVHTVYIFFCCSHFRCLALGTKACVSKGGIVVYKHTTNYKFCTFCIFRIVHIENLLFDILFHYLIFIKECWLQIH